MVWLVSMFLRLDLSVRNQVTVQRLEPWAEVIIPVGHTQALAVIADSLQQWGARPDQVEGIAVVVGVGSFTATRVAVTIANAWAYVHRIPVVGVSAAMISSAAEIQARGGSSGNYLSATYSGLPAIGKPSGL